MPSGVKVETQGNFFDHRNERFAKALNDSILDISVLGAYRVARQLKRGHGFRTGYLKGSINGGLVKNFHGQIDAGALMKGRNVVYASWIEGVSSRNATSGFKGYKMFWKVFQWLRKQPQEVKDIMKFHVSKELN